MSLSKIKIKLGAMEVEFEGSEAFLKEELPTLLSTVADLYQHSQVRTSSDNSESNGKNLNEESSNGGGNFRLQATTGAIAARLQVKGGADLALAAAARLAFSEGLSIFPRQRLLDEMKTATAYYKPVYGKNFSRTLHNLVKDEKLNEPSQGNFALTAGCLSELESRFA